MLKIKQAQPIIGFDKFLLLALVKEGPCSLAMLREKSFLFISLIWYQQLPQKSQPLTERVLFRFLRLRSRVMDGRANKAIHGTLGELEKLIEKGLAQVNDSQVYTLTTAGMREAERYAAALARNRSSVLNGILEPSATARNTTYLDFFLAVLKLGAGVASGSVGLIADGTDAAMDTVSAFMVWLGMKFHRETLSTILVIFGLFTASLSIGYDSVTHLAAAWHKALEPVAMPYLVIGVESIAICAAVLLFYYQRYVGKVSRSLTLISQSVDSKNHIFIGASVIIGAVFALFGIYYVDAIIGLFIALGIFHDALGLAREVISSRKGADDDYSGYSFPFEACLEKSNLAAFRNWILYITANQIAKTRGEIITSLERVFHPDNYIPVLSELKTTCREPFNFSGTFDDLLGPLKEHELIIEESAEFMLTAKGKDHLQRFIDNFKYFDVHQSDRIMLALSQDMNKK